MQANAISTPTHEIKPAVFFIVLAHELTIFARLGADNLEVQRAVMELLHGVTQQIGAMVHGRSFNGLLLTDEKSLNMLAENAEFFGIGHLLKLALEGTEHRMKRLAELHQREAAKKLTSAPAEVRSQDPS